MFNVGESPILKERVKLIVPTVIQKKIGAEAGKSQGNQRSG
jgi:hypothetical protein